MITKIEILFEHIYILHILRIINTLDFYLICSKLLNKQQIKNLLSRECL